MIAVLLFALCAFSACSVPNEGCNDHSDVENEKPLLEASDRPAEQRAPADGDRAPARTENVDAELQGILASEVAGQEGSIAISCIASDGSWSASVDGSDPHVSASMIKLAILGALFEAVDEGKVSLDQTVAVSAGDVVGGSGVIQSYGAGSTWTYRELAEHMIADSDNIAANMIIDAVGMHAVNEFAAAHGLDGTSLNRKMMDLDSGVENYTTAADVAEMLFMVANGSFVNERSSDLALEFLCEQSDASGIREGLPKGVVFAHKTGDLVNVENDGGIVMSAEPYIIVVLCQDVGEAASQAVMAATAQDVQSWIERGRAA